MCILGNTIAGKILALGLAQTILTQHKIMHCNVMYFNILPIHNVSKSFVTAVGRLIYFI